MCIALLDNSFRSFWFLNILSCRYFLVSLLNHLDKEVHHWKLDDFVVKIQYFTKDAHAIKLQTRNIAKDL